MASSTVTIVAKWVGDKAQRGADALDRKMQGINKSAGLGRVAFAGAAVAAAGLFAADLIQPCGASWR